MYQAPDKKVQTIAYAEESVGKVVEQDFDIVVLSVGMEIHNETRALAKTIGIDLTPNGFCKTQSFSPTATSRVVSATRRAVLGFFLL